MAFQTKCLHSHLPLPHHLIHLLVAHALLLLLAHPAEEQVLLSSQGLAATGAVLVSLPLLQKTLRVQHVPAGSHEDSRGSFADYAFLR
jgi:hypothetical protein